jgi:hypothetical protein
MLTAQQPANTAGSHTVCPCTACTVLVLSRCYGYRSNGLLPQVLTQAPDYPGRTCEMQCSDPKAADVSCGGTMNSVSVYVLTGVQGKRKTTYPG